MNLLALINQFFAAYSQYNFDFYFYNEAALKMELCIFLQSVLCSSGYKVQVERDISLFGINKGVYSHKIDIIIFKPGYQTQNALYSECYALEVKLPLKSTGELPIRMYDSIVDVKLMEDFKCKVLSSGKCAVVKTFVLTLTDNDNFYNNTSSTNTQVAKIAYYFQKGIQGTILKPYKKRSNGNRPMKVTVTGQYNVNWLNADLTGNWKYYCFECV